VNWIRVTWEAFWAGARMTRAQFWQRLPGMLAVGFLTFAVSMWVLWSVGELFYEGWWGIWWQRARYLIPATICLLAALLVLNRSPWEELAKECELDPGNVTSLHAPAARQAVIEKLQALLHEFPGHARIRSIALLLDDWNIENGLLTPTLKLKRGEIETRYAETIKELYKGHEVPV